MIIDYVLFNNEFSVLRARLEYLKPLVDVHVLVESDHTFSGKPKRMLFSELGKQLGPLSSKVVVAQQFYRGSYDFSKSPKSDTDETSPQFLMVRYQRDGGYEKLRGFITEDIVLVGDVDEIPSREAIAKIANQIKVRQATVLATSDIKPFGPVTLVQEHYLYSPHFRVNGDYSGTVIITNGLLAQVGPHRVREDRSKFPKVEGGGWKLDGFTNAEGLRTKAQCSAYQNRVNDKVLSEEHIAKCLTEGKDLLGRKTLKTEKVENTLPSELNVAV